MVHRIIKLPRRSSFFLFGARQTGKTTLIQSLFKKDVWTIDLLMNDVYFALSKDPSRFRREAIEKIEFEKVKIIFIDEVQRIPALLNEVQYLMQHYTCQFILTGSSARKLKRGGANLLAGRAVERRLYPLTFAELKDSFGLDDVLRYGSLPAVSGRTNSEKKDILSAYVHTYLREEIQAEGIARNIGGFSNFLDLAADHFGELVSYSAIARECHLPVRTVQSYYEILEDTLVGFRLLPYRKSLRKRLTAHPKFYLFDSGVTNAVNKHLTGTIDRKLFGRLFEQWIVIETQRIFEYSNSETTMHYWRTNHGAEVDLVLVKHGKIIAAYEIKSTPNITGSHLTGLRAFREDNKNVPCYVICTAENAFEIDKVKILPWRKYLSSLSRVSAKISTK
jgi:predicted AAA+ superfamily ATPase